MICDPVNVATAPKSNAGSAEAASSVVHVTKYYYHGGQRVAMRTDGVVYYLHTDHLGSTSLTTDANGEVVAHQLYHPYGTVRYADGTLPTDFGFTGQRDVPGTGLVFMHARYYHAGLGRFVSADTIVPELGNPRNLNRYAYAGNNPILYVDPSGHTPRKPPTPSEPPPPQQRVVYERGNFVLERIEFAPGTSGVQDREEWQHKVGKGAHVVGIGLEGVEAISLVLGNHIPFLADAIGGIDFAAETFGSWAYGETYIGKPHESLPEMTVIGQDVWVSGADFSIALAAKASGAVAGSLLGPEGTLLGYEGGMAVDMCTTGVSFVYDVGRIAHEIPTVGAIGFYKDEQSKIHIVALNYQRREGEDSSHH